MWKFGNSRNDRKEQKSSRGQSSRRKSKPAIVPVSQLTPVSSQSSQNVTSSSRATGGKGACVCGGCTCQKGITDIQALSSSHNSSAVDYHTSLDAWLNNVNKAVNAAWSKRHVQYVDVHVLMICWEENDIPHIDKEMKRLRNVFAGQFGYELHDLVIPASKSDLVIRRKVDDFIELHGRQDNLLIFYYAGHASPGAHSGAPPIWHSKNPTRESPGSSFDTSNIQSILARAQDDSPDVLLIYDCCHSLYAHPTNKNSGRAIVECLFAGGFETKVPIAGPDSFTAALIDELCEAIHSPTPRSVSDLHRGIIDRLQRWKARGIFGSDDAIIKDKNTGKVVLTKAVRTTPVHMFLSVNDAPRTIVLAPREKRPPEDGSSEVMRESSMTTAHGATLPRVLLAVRIVDDDNNTEALKHWLLSAPAEVVVFEKIYQSYSDLLMIELPLPVWDMLPRSPAVSFIGFTKGEKPLPKVDNTQIASSRLSQEHRVIAEIAKDAAAGPTQEDEGPQPGVGEPSYDQGLSGNSPLASIAHPDLQMHRPESEEDKALVASLNIVDQALVKAFARLGKKPVEMQTQDDFIFEEVFHQIRQLITTGDNRLVSDSDVQRHKAYLLRYINAKHLVEYDQPWLRISDRLGGGWSRFFGWRDDDERTEAISQAMYRSSTPRSGLFDTSISMGRSSRTALSMNVVFEDASGPISPTKSADGGPRLSPEGSDSGKDGDLGDIDALYLHDHYRSRTSHDKWMDLYSAEDTEPIPETEEDSTTDARPVEAPRIAEHSKHTVLPDLDVKGKERGTPYGDADYTYAYSSNQYDEESHLPHINPLNNEQVEFPMDDPRYQVHASSKFQPGEVFKAMWSEPMGANIRNTVSERTDASDLSADRLYVGFRRFIVVANDQGHCTCIPILSYGGKGCLKRGVKPSKHGIIYVSNGRSKGAPKLLSGEPKLGFSPIRMTMKATDETLPRESRVNYSKLITVEHNVRVYFIGSINTQDMNTIVDDAINSCWNAKTHRSRYHS